MVEVRRTNSQFAIRNSTLYPTPYALLATYHGSVTAQVNWQDNFAVGWTSFEICQDIKAVRQFARP